jgi:hypothetical protein
MRNQDSKSLVIEWKDVEDGSVLAFWNDQGVIDDFLNIVHNISLDVICNPIDMT